MQKITLDTGITLHKRSSVWYLDIHHPGHPRKQISLKTRDREHALLLARAHPAYRPPPPPSRTLETAVSAWLLEKKGELAASSYEIVERTLNRWKAAMIGKGRCVVGAITRDDMVAYRTVMKEAEYMASTINKEMSWVRQFAISLMMHKLIQEDFTARIKPLEVPRGVKRTLKRSEIRDLLSVAFGEIRDFIVLALETGARLGDLLSLKVEDVDYEDGLVTYAGQKVKKAYQVAVNPVALAMLKKYQAKTGPIFTTQRRTVLNKLCALGKKTGIGRVGPHMLRRTWATLIAPMVSTTTLQRLGGWADIETPARYYAAATLITPPSVTA